MKNLDRTGRSVERPAWTVLSSSLQGGLLCLFLLAGASAQAQQKAASISDFKHLGVASCSTSVCHGKVAPAPGKNVRLNEYRTWIQEDRHSLAYRTLELPESKRIAANMGLPSAATAKICLDCHADNMPADKRGPKFRIDDGVGCEACHGGAERWIESHAGESATHKDNLARGMYPSETPLDRAELCLSCHLGTKDRFATHVIMGAGHPRLKFELEGFTSTQPAHFNVDADYEERKGKIEGVNLWITGQIESARTMLTLLQTNMYATSSMFPELAFYDCHACHHPMENLRWNAERASMGIKPGTLRLQTHSYVSLQAIYAAFDPQAVNEMVSLVNTLVRAGQNDRGAVAGAAKNLLAFINQRTALSKRKYSKNDIVSLRKALIKYGASEKSADYATAEQIYLAVDSLSYTVGDRDSKKAALDALFKLIDKESAFSPAKFIGTAKNVQNQF